MRGEVAAPSRSLSRSSLPPPSRFRVLSQPKVLRMGLPERLARAVMLKVYISGVCAGAHSIAGKAWGWAHHAIMRRRWRRHPEYGVAVPIRQLSVVAVDPNSCPTSPCNVNTVACTMQSYLPDHRGSLSTAAPRMGVNARATAFSSRMLVRSVLSALHNYSGTASVCTKCWPTACSADPVVSADVIK